MPLVDDPFGPWRTRRTVSPARSRRFLVDFHAEATSEKIAMGWHLDGRVTAVVGTHTHVQTADERILPRGTAVHQRRRHDGPARLDHRRRGGACARTVSSRGLPSRFETASGNPRLNAVLIRTDDGMRRANDITRLALASTTSRPWQTTPPRGRPAPSHDQPLRPAVRRAAPDPTPEPPRETRRVYTVAQLTAAIRGLLEEKWFEVWVEGEALETARSGTPDTSISTLKDGAAQIKGVVFKVRPAQVQVPSCGTAST